jgi:HAE1 family hydrophobic/amphiphilic exporter-1
VFATGAGKEARNSVGTAVAGGMLLSTFLNIVFIPVLYVVVQSIRGRLTGGNRQAVEPA